MADLHDRIRAAIEARRQRAQAALHGPYESLLMTWPRMTGRAVFLEFIAAEDPATVLRHVDRDLKVLERHKQVVAEGWGKDALVCELTWMASDGWPIDWPCDDIRDLAEAYGVEIEETP